LNAYGRALRECVCLHGPRTGALKVRIEGEHGVDVGVAEEWLAKLVESGTAAKPVWPDTVGVVSTTKRGKTKRQNTPRKE